MNFEEVLRQYDLLSSQPKYIKMNDNGDYDIIIEEDIYQIDLNSYHDKSELPAIVQFNNLHKKGSKIEFKSMLETKFTFFIEYQVDKKGNGIYQDSGITNTKSDHYWISLGDDIDFIIKPSFLKWIFKYRKELKIDEGPSTTSDRNVTTGIYVPVDYIFQLLKMYREYQQGIGIEELISKLIETPEQHRKKLYNRLKK